MVSENSWKPELSEIVLRRFGAVIIDLLKWKLSFRVYNFQKLMISVPPTVHWSFISQELIVLEGTE